VVSLCGANKPSGLHECLPGSKGMGSLPCRRWAALKPELGPALQGLRKQLSLTTFPGPVEPGRPWSECLHAVCALRRAGGGAAGICARDMRFVPPGPAAPQLCSSLRS